MFVSEKASGEVVEPSLAGFVAFLETKNPNEEYTWLNANQCACAQYARTLGQFNEWLRTFGYGTWYRLNQIARGNNEKGPHTIGETLERAKAAL